MMVLVTYDVSFESEDGQKRLRNLAKVCLDHGVRVQYSVFECEVDPAQWVSFKAKLLKIYDPQVDSLRFYKLGKNWHNKVEHHGAKAAIDIFRDPLIL
ncbi:CRISPR-associated endonuclease Cas2 [Pseudoalteromonas rubra]|uniref:CRISPR-associated endoribonuclease Cas2 n=1 Tax=Pseudoalteromonas rubra TaxID=43658 RepID=A0A0F4QD99_9GAMM|nr:MULTISPECIES: CRISPR-associated endonuclease Cas2 [Pseudoalteromonas]ALU45906.1 CRISPR-associated protein Cas2 [Pseudoalteromonas rubra]KJZ04607.1 CRISPR-associated protein Cas2 [Pseudoalteromonas rubra]KNC66376.1 CRISPR-associated protein Cas2 [Pseudoalteromonas rubra]MDK1310326.1 CRISPR-associated endonuclease Cas2 [Pseudoalteromonas sp. R96]QPB85802.1 CRISPR-associated endonuclease Cas2 [Pseudoalteromonas rubra]